MKNRLEYTLLHYHSFIWGPADGLWFLVPVDMTISPTPERREVSLAWTNKKPWMEHATTHPIFQRIWEWMEACHAVLKALLTLLGSVVVSKGPPPYSPCFTFSGKYLYGRLVVTNHLQRWPSCSLHMLIIWQTNKKPALILLTTEEKERKIHKRHIPPLLLWLAALVLSFFAFSLLSIDWISYRASAIMPATRESI